MAWRDRLRSPLGERALAGSSQNGHAARLRTRSSAAAPPPSRLRFAQLLRPLPLLGAALVLLALVGYWSVYSATTQRTPVLVATHELSPGSTLGAADLRVAELAGDSRTLSALVPESALPAVLGRIVRTGLVAGAPLARAALAGGASAPSAFTLVLPALHALGGELRAGDRVSVLATFEAGAGGARARALARDLRVLAVGGAPAGIEAGSATIPVTLALPDPSLAGALALANSQGKIDLLREGGRASTAPIPPASEGRP